MSLNVSMAYPVAEQLPKELQDELVRRRSRNVFRMLMHSPKVVASFLSFTDALRGQNSLNGVWREIVILRVGHRYGASYEVHHHERIGRTEGMTEEQIQAVRIGPADPRLTDHERLLVQLADEVLDTHSLTATSRDRALAFLTVTQLEDFVLLVGYYQMVCNFLNVFGIEIEPAGT